MAGVRGKPEDWGKRRSRPWFSSKDKEDLPSGDCGQRAMSQTRRRASRAERRA